MQATNLIHSFVFKEHIIQLKKNKKKSNNKNQFTTQIADLGVVPTVERRERSNGEKEADQAEIEVEAKIIGCERRGKREKNETTKKRKIRKERAT